VLPIASAARPVVPRNTQVARIDELHVADGRARLAVDFVVVAFVQACLRQTVEVAEPIVVFEIPIPDFGGGEMGATSGVSLVGSPPWQVTQLRQFVDPDGCDLSIPSPA
jgi:hypothetical protein